MIDARAERWRPKVDDLVDAPEMYIKSIYELAEEGIPPLRARISERLRRSGPVVTQAIERLERGGLVTSAGRQLRLTELGLTRATRVMRKHRLAERFLTDVIGLPWAGAHKEACRWEHVMSEPVERRLVDLLDHPRLDPYGNPIPGLSELGESITPTLSPDCVLPLTEAAQGAGEASAMAVIARLAEPLQTDVELLERLDRTGVHPGARINPGTRGRGVTVAVAATGAELTLPAEVARHVYIHSR